MAIAETMQPADFDATRPQIDGDFEGKNLLSIDQFTRQDIERVLGLAEQMDNARHLFQADRSQHIPQLLSGFVLKALMFEDSSRTADTYLSAAAYLGAAPMQPNLKSSSINKGESDIETVRVFARNADGVIIRHKQAGFMDGVAQRIGVPFISGGNPGDHVLQTLKDLRTMKARYGAIDGSRVVFAGHMATYRAGISLLKGLCRFDDIDVTIVTPEAGQMPPEVIEQAKDSGVKVSIAHDLRPLLKEAGFFYIGRPALEYAKTESQRAKILEGLQQIGCQITHESMSQAHHLADIAHPLPHNDEIADNFYTDPRAVYEEQEAYGLGVNMAVQSLQFMQTELEQTDPFAETRLRLAA